MEFSYDFMIDLFSSFYEFFFRIATFLQRTPSEIMLSFSTFDAITFSFVNPFTNSTVYTTIGESALFSGFLGYMDMVGLATVPLWQGLLIQTSTIWLFVAVVKILSNLTPF